LQTDESELQYTATASQEKCKARFHCNN